jgi:hypothetical protein
VYLYACSEDWACLEENHGGDLLGGESLLLAKVLNLDLGVAAIVNDGEGPGLDVLLDGGVIVAATDQTPVVKLIVSKERPSVPAEMAGFSLDLLGIEDGVLGVHGSIVLSSLTDQTLLISEGDERRGGERTLLVGDDLDIGTLVDGHARVGGTC